MRSCSNVPSTRTRGRCWPPCRAPRLEHRLDLDALMGGEASDPSRWPAPFADRGADAPDLVDVGAGHQVRAWPGPLLEALA